MLYMPYVVISYACGKYLVVYGTKPLMEMIYIPKRSLLVEDTKFFPMKLIRCEKFSKIVEELDYHF